MEQSHGKDRRADRSRTQIIRRIQPGREGRRSGFRVRARAFDPTGALVGATIQEQTAQCFRNIDAILKAAGSSLERAVSATFILGEESDFAGMNEEWNRWFKVDPPARQGARLPIRPKGMKISIALIAEA